MSVGDTLRCETFRKVSSSLKAQEATILRERLHISLTIEVESRDFDASAPMLRLKGKNIVENEFVKMGVLTFSSALLAALLAADGVLTMQAYHTLEVEANRYSVYLLY